MLSERSQAHQNTYCIFHVYKFQEQEKQPTVREVRTMVIWGGVGGEVSTRKGHTETF